MVSICSGDDKLLLRAMTIFLIAQDKDMRIVDNKEGLGWVALAHQGDQSRKEPGC
jgi:hypothetical protein